MGLLGVVALLTADGGAGGGAPGGGGAGAGVPPGDNKPAGGAPGAGGAPPDKGAGEDVSGLKSALAKEREAAETARKEAAEAKRLLAELGKMAGGEGDPKAALEKLTGKLGAYEFAEKRNAEIDKAIAAATKDGTFVVDREKAAKLASRLRDAATLEGDVTEIVETLKMPKVADKPAGAAPGGKGTPTAPAGTKAPKDFTAQDWIALNESDPEEYKRLRAEAKKERRF